MRADHPKEEDADIDEKLKRVTRDTLALADRMFQGDKPASVAHEDMQFYEVSIALCIKARKALESILILCEHAKTGDAMALLRVLFDTVLYLLFMFEGGEEQRRDKASHYVHFCQAQHLRQLDLLIEQGLQTDKDHMQNRDALEKDLIETLGHGKLEKLKKSTNWYSGHLPNKRGGMRALAKYLDSKRSTGLEEIHHEQYLTINIQCSGIIHGTDIIEHIEPNEDGTFQIRPLSETKWFGPCLAYGSLRFAMTLEKLNEFLKWEYKDEIMNIGRRISEIPPRKLE